jgi:hypothetical protein
VNDDLSEGKRKFGLITLGLVVAVVRVVAERS